jgi:hypothetical protein
MKCKNGYWSLRDLKIIQGFEMWSERFMKNLRVSNKTLKKLNN